jgi:hypothetical protein
MRPSSRGRSSRTARRQYLCLCRKSRSRVKSYIPSAQRLMLCRILPLHKFRHRKFVPAYKMRWSVEQASRTSMLSQTQHIASIDAERGTKYVSRALELDVEVHLRPCPFRYSLFMGCIDDRCCFTLEKRKSANSKTRNVVSEQTVEAVESDAAQGEGDERDERKNWM